MERVVRKRKRNSGPLISCHLEVNNNNRYVVARVEESETAFHIHASPIIVSKLLFEKGAARIEFNFKIKLPEKLNLKTQQNCIFVTTRLLHKRCNFFVNK